MSPRSRQNAIELVERAIDPENDLGHVASIYSIGRIDADDVVREFRRNLLAKVVVDKAWPGCRASIKDGEAFILLLSGNLLEILRTIAVLIRVLVCFEELEPVEIRFVCHKRRKNSEPLQVLELRMLLAVNDDARAFLLVGPLDLLGLSMVLAAVIGLANPQGGAMARTRWAALARGRRDRLSFTATAMAYEGAVDESSFVVGPVLVSTVAGLVSPTAGLLLALVLAAVGQTGFALHPSSLPGRGRAGAHATSDAHRDRAPLPVAHVGFLLLAMAAIGLVFGASQTGVAAATPEIGRAHV